MAVDKIADMLTRTRNAVLAKHNKVVVPHSKIKESIAKILQSEGLIGPYEVVKKKVGKDIVLPLKYAGKNKAPVIRGLKRVSSPGHRVYVDSSNIPRVLKGLGIAILSTSSGVMTDAVCRAKSLGGEVLCLVW